MRKKLLVTLLAVLMIASVLSACGKGKGDYSDKTEFRALYSADVQTLNYLNTTLTNDMYIPANCQDWLVEYDSYGKAIPSMAEKWEVSEDGLTWTFHLRDAKWYDSEGAEVADVTAKDFVNAIEYAYMTDASAAYMLPAAKIKGSDVNAFDDGGNKVQDASALGVEAKDDKTLVFTLSDPCPYFLTCMSYGCFAPMNEKTLKAVGDWDNRASWTVDQWNSFADALDGVQANQLLNCGPYHLSRYSAGEEYVMEKTNGYWDEDKVFIEKITNTYNAEAATLSGELYQRGEVEEASITSTLAKSWAQDEATKDLFHPDRIDASYSYFFSFNFNPEKVMSVDAKYEPENWKKAVVNENFRKSIFYGINRVGATKISDENNADNLVMNTLTTKNFVSAGGKDYTDQDQFKANFVNKDGVDKYFNEEKAKEYRDKAKEELKAAGVTLPVKVLLVYNPNVSDWDAECIYLESQLEELLGQDYIDIMVELGPTQSFLTNVRRAGKYMLLKTNYGCDYADPRTYTDPFAKKNSYGFMDKSEDPGIKKISDDYNQAVADADAITDPNKMAERYSKFADAECILIEHAMCVPFGVTCGYVASYLDPFEGAYAPYGVANLRHKGQHILEKPLNTEEFNEKYEAWQKERAKASK